MEGGAKTKAQSNPNPRKATFGMKDLNAALDNIMGMDTGIKKQRRVTVQPARAPSERAKAVAAKKAETKVKSVSTKPKSASKPKPASKQKAAPTQNLSVVKEEEEESVKPVRRVPKHPKRIPIESNHIVKRTTSETFNFEKIKGYEEYMGKFNDLFNEARDHFGLNIRNHGPNEGFDINEKESSEMIVHITDQLYFKIRDKLIEKLEL